ncbi:hypothetical protein CY34DRAFT_811792 [Suillus luteus UH-Slu-Lm8-n1]|uniref:Uncharacterized protein n=1 Tax=Suillus luteus UH-Slu-Lm8-n1 TaxID=930992 RepID=A0A0D0A2I9_9AGAM|nr:hypothetical protein CY34DRAFT_811792 [Suillus luteus UH-Slu-Lm8-n1]
MDLEDLLATLVVRRSQGALVLQHRWAKMRRGVCLVPGRSMKSLSSLHHQISGD